MGRRFHTLIFVDRVYHWVDGWYHRMLFLDYASVVADTTPHWSAPDRRLPRYHHLCTVQRAGVTSS